MASLEREAGCAYCRVGLCAFKGACKGQSAMRGKERMAEGEPERRKRVGFQPPVPRRKLRRRGRRRPRGVPPKGNQQHGRAERQGARPAGHVDPSEASPPAEHTYKRRGSESDSGSESMQGRAAEPQVGESSKCCSKEPRCNEEGRVKHFGLWFCAEHDPSTQKGEGTAVLLVARASYCRCPTTIKIIGALANHALSTPLVRSSAQGP